MRVSQLLSGLVLALALGGCGNSQPRDSEPAAASTEAGKVSAARTADTTATLTEQTATMAEGDGGGRSVVCSEDEQTIFSCPTDGGKRISVCGKNGEVEYRFGAEQAELTLAGGRFGSVPFSGGGEAQVAFANGETRYVVFSRVVRTNFTAGETNNPEFTDGVMVLKGNRKIAERLCTPGTAESVDVMAGEDYGGVQSELFFAG